MVVGPQDVRNVFARNLARAMDAAGVKDRRDAAKRWGVSDTMIGKYLRAEQMPSTARLAVIAKDLRTTEAELTGSTDYAVVREPIRAYQVRSVEGPSDIDPESEITVPVVDVEVSGGPGRWVPEFIETSFRMPFQQYWFRDRGCKPENVKVMRVSGRSMEPVLFDGDRVVVDTARTTLRSERVYVIWHHDEARVKRLFRHADGRIRVVSDNRDKEAYPDEYVAEDDADALRIIGQVIDRSGAGGL